MTFPERTILSVVGPHSGCGKTTFVASVVRAIPGLGTLKISPARNWPTSAPADAALVGDDFYLDSPAELARPGKDTALYLEAGAAVVNRLRHRAEGLVAGLEAALERYPVAMPVLVESSSAVRLLAPVAVVLVVRLPLREMKPTTQAILSQVTDLLVNVPEHRQDAGATTPQAPDLVVNAAAGTALAVADLERLQEQFPTLRPRFTWRVNLAFDPLPPELLRRLRRLFGKQRQSSVLLPRDVEE